MGRLARLLVMLSSVLLCTLVANAQCGDPTWSCVTSFSISPGIIQGDGAETETGYVAVHIAPNASPLVLQVVEQGSVGNSWFVCNDGSQFSGGCRYSGVSGDVTVSFSFNGVNHGTTNLNGSIWVYVVGFHDPGLTVNTVVTPVPAPITPPNDPDGPCSTCGYGGAPINFANGDTWIRQQDYSIPGLGGGLALIRTWNSLWPLKQPVEESGIFGDSWRSNLEERIQSVAGGVVKYWKGNGSLLFYSYNSLSGGYILTAPADDQTTLSFDPIFSQWTVTQKDGTTRIFNSAGYLTSIVDRNGNTTTIVIDANNQNRIATVTDAANRTLTFNYANGSFPRLCTSVADSVGTVATYTYDTAGRLTQVLYPDNSQYNFQFNDPNSSTLISAVVDTQSKTIESHTYDSQRRGLTSQQANGVNKVSVTYLSSSPQSVVVKDSLGHNGYLYFSTIVQRTYLTQADVNSYCGTCGYAPGTGSYLFPSGYPSATFDGDNNTTLYTYDSQGNLASKSLPDPVSTGGTNGTPYDIWSYTYNSFGEALTVTDPLLHTTTNQYDSHGNLLSTTTPSPDGTTAASTTYFTYYPNGTLKYSGSVRRYDDADVFPHGSRPEHQRRPAEYNHVCV